MRKPLQFVAVVAMFAFSAGCSIVGDLGGLIPLPATTTPVPTPGATRTPQPDAPLTVSVRVPSSTPPDAIVQLVVPDLVTGGIAQTVVLEAGPDLTYSGALSLPDGVLLRYRYQIVTGGLAAPEVTLNNERISYRAFHNSAGPTITDVVAAWDGFPGAAQAVTLTGVVRDAVTGAAVPGIVVSAGGKQVRSGHDGRYVFTGLVPGAQVITAFAADGYRRPQAQAVALPDGSSQLDFALALARTVNVSFLVNVPAEVRSGAQYAIAGDVPQLGGGLVAQENGSVVAANRVVRLASLSDGRWSVTVPMYDGQYVRYRYTLGSGSVNGEMRSDGQPRVHEFVVPGQDVTLQEVITTFDDQRAVITFRANAPANTPDTDDVALQVFRDNRWQEAVPMWPVGQDMFEYVYYNPLGFVGEAGYRVCRNLACDVSPDAANGVPGALGYRFAATVLPQTLTRSVGSWYNWRDAAPYVTSLSALLTPRPGMVNGIGFDATWRPTNQPYYPQIMRDIRGIGSNTVRIPVVWEMTDSGDIRPHPALTVPREDLLAQIRLASDQGLRVALVPLVRPAPEGPYRGDPAAYWATVAPGKSGSWWEAWHGSYRRFMLAQAEIAQNNGVDFLYVVTPDLGAALQEQPFAPADAAARWQNLITETRTVFLRQVVVQVRLAGNPGTLSPAPADYWSLADVLDVEITAGLTNDDTPTREALVETAARLLDEQVAPLTERGQVYLSLRYPSVNRGATGCVLLDGICAPLRRFAPTEPLDRRLAVDLEEQALVYDAILDAVNVRPWVRGVFSEGYYVPVATRGMSTSTRSKPAEDVLGLYFLGWGN